MGVDITGQESFPAIKNTIPEKGKHQLIQIKTYKKGTTEMEENKVNFNEQEVKDVNGKSKATVSMILGIISLVCIFTGIGAIASVVLGIIGLVFAKQSKELGYSSGTRTAGFVCSLIGLIVGGIVVVCVLLIGGAAAAVVGAALS